MMAMWQMGIEQRLAKKPNQTKNPTQTTKKNQQNKTKQTTKPPQKYIIPSFINAAL